MAARAAAGLFVGGARAPGGGHPDRSRAVSRSAAAAHVLARAIRFHGTRAGRRVSLPDDHGADPDTGGDRSARWPRHAEAPCRSDAPDPLGELPRRAVAFGALRLRFARPADGVPARRPPIRRRNAARRRPRLPARDRLALPPAT